MPDWNSSGLIADHLNEEKRMSLYMQDLNLGNFNAYTEQTIVFLSHTLRVGFYFAVYLKFES